MTPISLSAYDVQSAILCCSSRSCVLPVILLYDELGKSGFRLRFPPLWRTVAHVVVQVASYQVLTRSQRPLFGSTSIFALEHQSLKHLFIAEIKLYPDSNGQRLRDRIRHLLSTGKQSSGRQRIYSPIRGPCFRERAASRSYAAQLRRWLP